ncbi:MAG: hypothetical protein JJ966_06230 [Balneolaceae bacterium]|nr:hypothetical protein [Balneolaceae bacterium]
MAHRALIAIIFFVGFGSFSTNIEAQPYEFAIYPDAWFNSTDGVRLGARFLGEMQGTFKDGPHRVDAGIWLATKLPEKPVSYYLSYTNPIPAISSYMNEGSVQLISSVRTGYSVHKLQINKRWQRGFQELDYIEASMFTSRQGHFDAEYQPYRYLWQQGWRTMIGANIRISEKFDRSQFFGDITVQRNVDNNTINYSTATITLNYVINYSGDYKIRLRNFLGFTSDLATPEFKFLSTNGAPVEWQWNAFSRASGTVPTTWLNDGFIHIEGGANLRGYQAYMSELLATIENSPGGQFEFPLHHQSIALNAEIDFPNPLHNKLTNIKYLGDLIEFRTYTFIDVSRGKGTTVLSDPNVEVFPAVVPPKVESVFESEQWLADAGLGFQFSINIPDYLGKDRGIFVRYDLPLWLSSTMNNESNFKFRNVIGFGAIFNF